jgi:hypothetical protein
LFWNGLKIPKRTETNRNKNFVVSRNKPKINRNRLSFGLFRFEPKTSLFVSWTPYFFMLLCICFKSTETNRIKKILVSRNKLKINRNRLSFASNRKFCLFVSKTPYVPRIFRALILPVWIRVNELVITGGIPFLGWIPRLWAGNSRENPIPPVHTSSMSCYFPAE